MAMNDMIEFDYITNFTEKDHPYIFFSKKPKPVMIYFRSPNDDVTKGDSTVVADYNKVLPVDVVVCDG